jgi:cell division septal protein FtsQ
MKKAHKISLLFVLIFLLGLIGFIASINLSLNKKSQVDIKSAKLYTDEKISFSAEPTSYIIYI